MSTDTKYTACCKTLINSDKFWTLWLSQGFIFRIRHRDAGTLYGREGQNPNNFWQLHYSYSNQGVGNRALIRILSPRRLFNSTLTHVCSKREVAYWFWKENPPSMCIDFLDFSHPRLFQLFTSFSQKILHSTFIDFATFAPPPRLFQRLLERWE